MANFPVKLCAIFFLGFILCLNLTFVSAQHHHCDSFKKLTLTQKCRDILGKDQAIAEKPEVERAFAGFCEAVKCARAIIKAAAGKNTPGSEALPECKSLPVTGDPNLHCKKEMLHPLVRSQTETAELPKLVEMADMGDLYEWAEWDEKAELADSAGRAEGFARSAVDEAEVAEEGATAKGGASASAMSNAWLQPSLSNLYSTICHAVICLKKNAVNMKQIRSFDMVLSYAKFAEDLAVVRETMQ